MTLQENLDALKGLKLNSKTIFGNDDYMPCGFYNCKFYGNTIERRIHIKNQHSTFNQINNERN
jgi:hypothetical protein